MFFIVGWGFWFWVVLGRWLWLFFFFVFCGEDERFFGGVGKKGL